MKLNFWLCGTLLLVCAACGGGSNSDATVNGAIRGNTLPVSDTISATATVQFSGPPATTINVGVIGISSSGGLCGKLTAGQEPKNSQYLLLFLTDINSVTGQTTAPSAAGTYSVYSGTGTAPTKLAIVNYIKTDATCRSTAATMANGISGMVVLTAASNGSYSGTFDITFDTGDHVTGSFRASNCAALSTLISEQRTTTCI